MTYVVTEICVDCKYTSCVDVCPVEAFHETPDRLYINPDTCIDCNACVDECPVTAIFSEADLSCDRCLHRSFKGPQVRGPQCRLKY